MANADSAYGGNVQGIAALLFGKYVLIFELTSALLITAAVGAMVLAHKERTAPRKTQAVMAKELLPVETTKDRFLHQVFTPDTIQLIPRHFCQMDQYLKFHFQDQSLLAVLLNLLTKTT